MTDEEREITTAQFVDAIQRHEIKSFEEHPAVTYFHLGNGGKLALWAGGWDHDHYFTDESDFSESDPSSPQDNIPFDGPIDQIIHAQESPGPSSPRPERCTCPYSRPGLDRRCPVHGRPEQCPICGSWLTQSRPLSVPPTSWPGPWHSR